MKQLVQSYRDGEIWLAEVPAPAVADQHVLVRTARSVVSAGTERMLTELASKSLLGKAAARPDLVRKVIKSIRTEGLFQALEKVSAKLDAPVALGYSCAGTVVEVGRGVAGLTPGDRVACGGAGSATHGEFNSVPVNLCVRIPDGVEFEDAAFAYIGAIALQGVRQADVRIGERVAVIGLGLIGLIAVQLLKAAGCRVIGCDPDPDRCRLAETLGAAKATAPGGAVEAAMAFSEGLGVDAVIITAATPSNEPIEQAADMCRAKGRIVALGFVGLHVPRDVFYRKELDLRLSMSSGPGRYDRRYEEHGQDYPFAYVRWTEQRNMQAFLELVAAGQVSPAKLVTHRFGIDEALGAYEVLKGRGDRVPEGQGGRAAEGKGQSAEGKGQSAEGKGQSAEGKGQSAEGKEQGAGGTIGILILYPEAEGGAGLQRTVAIAGGRRTPGAVRVGFIGAGNFAKSVLLPALKKIEGVDLRQLCAATGISSVGSAGKYGFAAATSDALALLADKDITTVFMATRHDLHAEYVCRALEAGKHVFVEKPLCITPEELDRIRLAYAKAGSQSRVLMVGFNRRFSPHAAALVEPFRNRSTPMTIACRVNAGKLPADSWVRDVQVSGGRIVGEVCHFVDLCEYWVGAPARRVYAAGMAAARADLSAEDSVAATIEYADGSVAVIQYLSTGSTGLAKERIEVHAGGLSAVIDDFQSTTIFRPDGGKDVPVSGRQDKGHRQEIAAFVQAVRDGKASPIDAESLFRTTAVTFAIQDSLRTGKPAEI